MIIMKSISILFLFSIVFLSGFIILIDFSFNYTSPNLTMLPKDNLNEHPPFGKIGTTYLNQSISINDNSGFSSCNCVTSGNGTIESPYLIENIYINGYSFVISSTRAYFYVFNVWVNGSIDDDFGLYNVTNGLFVNDSASSSGDYGFLIYNSTNCTIMNGYSFNNFNGGFDIYFSQNITVMNNKISDYVYGLYLDNNKFIQIVNNSFLNETHEIYVFNNNNSIIIKNTLLAYQGRSSKLGGIGVYFSYNNLISNNSASYLDFGFDVENFSSFNVFSNNSANNCLIGFDFFKTTNNTFSFNIALYNDIGIDVRGTSYSTFISNYAKFNQINFYDDGTSFYNYYSNNVFSSSIPSNSMSSTTIYTIPQSNNNLVGLSVQSTFIFLVGLLIVEIKIFNFVSLIRSDKRKIKTN